MKNCPKCKTEKPLEAFSKRKGERLQSWCKECLREHNKKTYQISPNRRNQVRACSAKYRKILEDFMFDYLTSHPCVACGQTNILTLHFDHLRDKKFNISDNLKSTSLDMVKSEIEKCQVLCANCHAIKTATQSNNWKLKRL